MIYITVDFYDEFQCIADACPNTCCSGWGIMIDKPAYEKIMKVEDKLPVKDWLVERDGIITVKYDNNKCPMLNENNLCRIVLSLGPQYLSHVCDTYPRVVTQYGSIVESYLNLSCPEIVTKLMEKKYIDFCYREDEIFPSDYIYTQLYLFESSVRFSIINIIQSVPDISLNTRLFASYNILDIAIRSYQNNQLDYNAIKADVDSYFQQESLSSLDSTLHNIVNETNRYTFLQQLQTIMSNYTAFEHFTELIQQSRTYFEKDDFESYQSDLRAFRHYIKSYDTFYTNYWAYHIFSDTVVIPDYNLAKDRFIYAAAEFCLIQSLALAAFAEKKELNKDEYIYIISCVCRRMEHDSNYKKEIIDSLKKNNSINVATLLLMIFI